MNKKTIPYYIFSSLLTISLVVFLYIFINYKNLDKKNQELTKKINTIENVEKEIKENIEKEEENIKILEENNKEKIEEYEIWINIKNKITQAIS